MSQIENNATVIRFEQLPDCLFRIWVKPDWDGTAAVWKPGQFLRLGVLSESANRKTLRAMTIIDVQDGVFEFYMVAVTNGVTSPRLAALQPGQRCCLEPNITGRFTMENLPVGEHLDLWMMGTGTGIAPYLAMLKYDTAILKQYRDILFVHSVRHTTHLCYQQEIEQYAQQFSSFQYVPVVTRPSVSTPAPKVLTERIPVLLRDRKLETHTKRNFTATDSVVMLCGHPGMISQSIAQLEPRGLQRHRRRRPGNIVAERYF